MSEDKVTDWLGQEIRKGDKIIYARTYGSGGVEMVEARVTRVDARHTHVWCQPLKRSRSRLFPGDRLRPVKLSNPKTLVVMHP